MEAKPYGAQQKNMGKVVTCWLPVFTLTIVPNLWLIQVDSLSFSFTMDPGRVWTILALCELAPWMEEWLVEEAPPVTLRLYSNQEATSLLSISHFLFFGF